MVEPEFELPVQAGSPEYDYEEPDNNIGKRVYYGGDLMEVKRAERVDSGLRLFLVPFPPES